MRGPVAYDDGYISRKMGQLQTQPPPMAPPAYGRQPPPPGYMQKRSASPAPNLTTMESPLIINPQVKQPMKQKADLFADNVHAETVAMNKENAPRSRHRHRMLDDVAVRARSGADAYATRRSYYWQYPHYKGLATRRSASVPRRMSMIEPCPVHGTEENACDPRAADDTEIDGGYAPMAAPMAAPPQMRRLPPPPPPPMYYDYGYAPYADPGYDYYGGGYAYPQPPMAPPPMQPRMSRYDAYMEEDPELASMAGAGPMAAGPRQSLRPRTPPQVPTPIKGRGDMPPSSMAEFDQRESEAQKSGKAMAAAHSRDLVPKEPHSRGYLTQELPESEGERHLAKMSARYPSYSEPQMLQDHVDKMRIRLKSLAYSLDPTGPVPEIVIPERAGSKSSALVESSEDSKKKHTMALEYKEMPNLSTRRSVRTYPEDEYMKDNLRIKCLSHYKTTRTAADYYQPKNYIKDDLSGPIEGMLTLDGFTNQD